jgi:CHAT domain-containing protein/multidrug efflux pump subunit AcrA (membrane-fusion protein)
VSSSQRPVARWVAVCAFALLPWHAPAASAATSEALPPAAAGPDEQDPDALLDRLLEATLATVEGLPRAQYAEAEEILTSLERSYAGGNPAAPQADRRRAIQVRRLLLKLHRQHLGETGEVIERDCYAIAWMSDAMGDRQVALDHYACYLRAISARLGPTTPKALEARSLYAQALAMVDRLVDAEREHQETIAALKALAAPAGRELAAALMSYASLLERQARFDEYESALRQAIAATEAASGAGSENHLFVLGALINFLRQWSRSDEADALAWQSYTALDTGAAKESFMMALASWRAGGAAMRAQQPEEALQLFALAHELHLKHMGGDYLHLGSIKVSMAQAHKANGQPGMARQRLQEAIAFFDKDKTQPPSDSIAQAHIELGQLLVEEGAAAEGLRSLVRAESVLSALQGGCSAGLVRTLFWRSRAHGMLHQPPQAKAALQRGLRCARRLVDSAQSLRVDSLDARLALRPFLNHFIRQAMTAGSVGDDLFEALQLAHVSETSATVARLTGASLTGSAEFAALVRRREDLLDHLRRIDRLDAPPDGRVDAAAALRAKSLRPSLESSLADLDRQLSSHPLFGVRGSRDLPVTAEAVARVLRPGEALVVFHFDEEQGLAWASSGACTAAAPILSNAAALAAKVRHIRQGLQLREGRPTSFDPAAAHELYRLLFSSIEHCLHGVEHVFVVAPGPLGALPLGVLVLQAGDPNGQNPTQWLLQRYAVSVVPSVGTLVTLRPERGIRAGRWQSPFFAIGDPVLPATRGAHARSAVAALGELPDTTEELRKMASTLGASGRHLLLREAATAEALSRVNLADYQFLAFATHGLSADEVPDRGEPALVLSPSRNGSSLLLASDVAKLNITADLVILSACNTAASDGSQRGDWLSGLTRAFFRAGARSVLASHWYVSSAGTTALTTRVLEHHRHPGAPAGKAQALRRAAMELIETNDPLLSHPVVWGAFSLVGDGAAPP